MALMTVQIIYQLHNLTQTYNGRTVLQIEQLEIHESEILAIVGPSGAGKSTLLRLLNFLEKPSEGYLNFENSSLNSNIPPLEVRRKVTTVFQSPVLLNRSVAANVAYGLKVRRQSKKAINQAVADALPTLPKSYLIFYRSFEKWTAHQCRFAALPAEREMTSPLPHHLLDHLAQNIFAHSIYFLATEKLIFFQIETIGTVKITARARWLDKNR